MHTATEECTPACVPAQPTPVQHRASPDAPHPLARAAQISHVMLRTDPAALGQRTKGECNELLTEWKGVIGDDLERFARCARERSECVSRSRGGKLPVLTCEAATECRSRAVRAGCASRPPAYRAYTGTRGSLPRGHSTVHMLCCARTSLGRAARAA